MKLLSRCVRDFSVYSIITLFVVSQIVSVHSSFAATPLDFTGYAWSDTIGWISMNCANTASCATSSYKVSLDTTTNLISGYAWSENVGWIEFGTPSSTTGCPSGVCAAQKSGVNVIGWARATSGDGVYPVILTPGSASFGVISQQTPATTTYSTAGAQSFVVPVGVTSLSAVLTGAGGSPATTTAIAVTPGETLTVTVGQNGAATALMRGATTLATGSGLGAAISFASKVDYAAATTPMSVALGDVNGDGKPDVVIAAHGTPAVSVFINNGNGTLQPKVDYAANSVEAVTLLDMNADAKLDIVTGNRNVAAPSASVFRNNGNGTFAARTDYTSGNYSTSIATGDFNGDGQPDIVTGNETANTVSVLLNIGFGALGAKTDYITGAGPSGVVVADVNADGKKDIITSNYAGSSISVLLGNGNGTFAAKTDYAGGGNLAIATGDFNGDGKPDIVTANWIGTAASVFLNNGNGTFAAPVNYPTGNGPGAVVVGDFNNDGKLDIATANYQASTISVLLGNGNGTFGAKNDYTTGTIGLSPTGIGAADLDGDGKLDIVTANDSANTISVLLNTTPVSSTGSAVLTYTGSAPTLQPFTVPAGVTSLAATLTGGGGTPATTNNIAVTPGETLTVTVGINGGATTLNRAAVTLATGSGNGSSGSGAATLSYTASNPTPLNGTDGWISLSSANGGGGTYGVTVGTNALGGYAWGSEVLGWLDFSAVSFTPPCAIANVCSVDHTQSINTDAWCTVATTTCGAGLICKDAGGLCGAGNPAGTMTFNNQKVKRGKTVSISWNVLYASTCVVQGTNGDSWTPASSSAQTSQPIQNETTYTLTCQPVGGGTPVLLDTKKVTLIPSIREF
jgi:FG-GAP-like repeat/FG-GAP repeat